MSDYLYLACMDHDPVIVSENRVGNSIEALKVLRRDYAHRDVLVESSKSGIGRLDPAFSLYDQLIWFFHQHPKCRLMAYCEGGKLYSLEGDSEQSNQ